MFLIGRKELIWRGALFASRLGGGGAVLPQPVPPSNTAVPAVTGTPQVGEALAASTGSWAGDAPITYEFQWQSSADGSTGWADIASATASTVITLFMDTFPVSAPDLLSVATANT